MIDLPVLVLCGGLGTRLRPAVSDRPKALAPVGTRSFLELQLESLRDRGARHFVLCVGHRADQIESTLGDGSLLGVRIDYSPDGETLLGTGGALRRAARHFAPAAIVVNGDTHIDVDLGRLVSIHSSARERGAVATLTLAEVPNASRFGAVDVAGGRVTAFREKHEARGAALVNAGVYIIERDLIERIPVGELVSLERDVFPAALRDGLPLAAYRHPGPFRDIGTPDDYRAFARERESTHAA